MFKKGKYFLPFFLLMSHGMNAEEYLVKFKSSKSISKILRDNQLNDAQTSNLNFDNWYLIKGAHVNKNSLLDLSRSADVEYVQPNYKITIPENYKIDEKLLPQNYSQYLSKGMNPDNLPIPTNTTDRDVGPDPLFTSQWGMIDIGAREAWKVTRGDDATIVAVIDTGVDYTHPDLIGNLWTNPGETGYDAQGRLKSENGIDDDHNGYIDDVVGWDFAAKDRYPYDLALGLMDIVMKGGNPGHGTHCAGNVAARGENNKGISGVAPRIKIMPLRFITENGQGTTADAIQAIKYAVDNGARVLSNSWGSEGEDSDQAENTALRQSIKYAEDHGVLFIAAAGNGHQGKGYDNDTDAKPGYPASYPNENIISVAAIDVNNNLGAFSNWGRNTVDIAAPGVKVFSTTVGGKYSDIVVDLFGMKVTWDGTSMATPHVAGAVALYWSLHPTKNWREVKEALLKSAEPVASLQGKMVSNGKLNLKNFIK